MLFALCWKNAISLSLVASIFIAEKKIKPLFIILDCVITQVVPKLYKGYGRGNHRQIFGLPVLAYQQSERALSLGFSFVDDDFRLVIEFNGFCFDFGGMIDAFK